MVHYSLVLLISLSFVTAAPIPFSSSDLFGVRHAHHARSLADVESRSHLAGRAVTVALTTPAVTTTDPTPKKASSGSVSKLLATFKKHVGKVFVMEPPCLGTNQADTTQNVFVSQPETETERIISHRHVSCQTLTPSICLRKVPLSLIPVNDPGPPNLHLRTCPNLRSAKKSRSRLRSNVPRRDRQTYPDSTLDQRWA